MNKSNRSDMLYYDVLQYLLPQYQKYKSQCKKMMFVSEPDVNIKGVVQYRPYNIPEVKKFKRFIKK